MPSTNHPLHSTVTEPLLWSLRETPPSLRNEVVFEGRTTTTADGREEYTVSMADLAPDEQMTHWLTVDAAHVVSLENSR
ncbi:MAG: DUF7511 domain-containing protein [Halohasta sp.]